MTSRQTSGFRIVRPLSVFVILSTILSFWIAPAAAGDRFPPISEAEKNLNQVAGHPNAPAVVIFSRGRFEMEPNGKGSNSVLRVQERIKILTEEGLGYAEIRLPHSSYRRLIQLSGRTVLPSGEIVELSEDDIFKRRTSRIDRRYVTAAALPAVEVGAIIDYQFDISYQSIVRLKPWSFQSRIPTLLSEIVYVVPDHIGFRPWTKALPDRIKVETIRMHPGRMVKATMESMPAIPDEPFSFPLDDLANQFMILPTEYVSGGSEYDLLTSWVRVCSLYDDEYDSFRKSRNVKKQARAIATAANKLEQAQALYRWVRDSIEMEPIYGVSVREDATADQVLTSRRGDLADKALLLHSMLDAVKIDASPVWATYRSSGRADLNSPNPGWFDLVIVRAEIDGELYYLDPSDDRVGFARLSPELEGTSALIVDTRKPQVVTLPVTPFAENRRLASIQLAVAVDGSVSGEGELELTGHHAWRNMRRQDDAELTAHWQSWLEERIGSFLVSDVTVTEEPDRRRIAVSWRMDQAEEEVLGDEVSLELSRPLGPVKQVFETTQRHTPARFAFPDRDQVELTLTWPAGWVIDVEPRATSFQSSAGEINASMAVDEAGQSLHYTRRFDITAQEFVDSRQLVAVQRLFERIERHDAQQLVLVRR